MVAIEVNATFLRADPSQRAEVQLPRILNRRIGNGQLRLASIGVTAAARGSGAGRKKKGLALPKNFTTRARVPRRPPPPLPLLRAAPIFTVRRDPSAPPIGRQSV